MKLIHCLFSKLSIHQKAYASVIEAERRPKQWSRLVVFLAYNMTARKLTNDCKLEARPEHRARPCLEKFTRSKRNAHLPTSHHHLGN